MSTSCQQAALSFCLAVLEFAVSYTQYSGALTSGITDIVHRSQETEKKEGDKEKRKRGIMYGDILVGMSAPLLGSFNLTFMFKHSLLLPIFFLLVVSPPPFCSLLLFLLIIQSASPLLAMNLTH